MGGAARCHRQGPRKRRPLSRDELVAKLHRGLRPRLDAGQLRDLALCHNLAFDQIVAGESNEQTLWDYAGSSFTWYRAADLLGTGLAEMAVQLQVCTRLCERWKRTGAVRFDGRDLDLARLGVVVMDELARIVDRPTAIAAAEWSERELQRLAESAQALREGATA